MCINCTFFMHLRKQVNLCNFFKKYTKKLLFRCTSNEYICSAAQTAKEAENNSKEGPINTTIDTS